VNSAILLNFLYLAERIWREKLPANIEIVQRPQKLGASDRPLECEVLVSLRGCTEQQGA